MFKVDDAFYDHPKVKRITRGALRKGAIALWTLTGSWCDRYGTDGLVPEDQVLEVGGTTKEAKALAAVDLWHGPGHDCDLCEPVPAGHYRYHDWSQWNDLKIDVDKRRKKARDRMRKMRNGEHGQPEPTTEVA